MPVLFEKKKLTRQQLEHLKPYILELRRREQKGEIQLLQQIKKDEEQIENKRKSSQRSKGEKIRMQVKVC